MCSQTSIPGFYTSDYVHPDCRPFAIRNSHTRALILLHGLTGTPNDFQDYAQFFAKDLDVFVPLLPGHGSHICHLQHLTLREFMIPLPALLQFLAKNYAEVHLAGMSYGAILAIAAALKHPPTSLSLIAPAFKLVARAERNIIWIRRMRLHRWFPRFNKARAYRNKDLTLSNRYTYKSVALGPTLALHQLAAELTPRLREIHTPVWHSHGDLDDITPIQENHALLKKQLKRYDFQVVPRGKHVLTLGSGAHPLAKLHLAWLQRHYVDYISSCL